MVLSLLDGSSYLPRQFRHSAPAGHPASFLLVGGCLQELQWFKQQHSSFFVGEQVVQGAPLAFNSLLCHGAAATACRCVSVFCTFCIKPPVGLEALVHHSNPTADGGVFLGTPVDPLLVVLPLLERARAEQNVFQDLEQILR